MPRRIPPRIEVVRSLKPFKVLITWVGGDESSINLGAFLQQFRVFGPLVSDPNLFATARVGEYGTHLSWSDEMEISADTLHRLAREQSGVTMSPDAFRGWRERKKMTLEGAARALGISRRMVAYYEQGARPIPRIVALATRGLDAN